MVRGASVSADARHTHQGSGIAPSMIAVQSSVIRAIDWADGTLTVVFHSGRSYDHPGVPYSVFRDFLNACSKGAFYSREIRGRYR